MKKNQIKKFYLVFLSIFILNTSVLADALKIGIITPDNNKYQTVIQIAISEHNDADHKINIEPRWRYVSSCDEISQKISGFSDDVKIIINMDDMDVIRKLRSKL